MRKDIDAAQIEIEKWLREGVPRFEICRRLDCQYETLRRRLAKWNLLHLKNQNRSNRVHPEAYKSAKNYLDTGKRIQSHALKLKLFREELKERTCESCKLSEWLGHPIMLELDHIDGNKYNNNLKNLRILCPNCHAQTKTYKSKNKRARVAQ